MFIGPSEHHHTKQTSKFNYFTWSLHNVFKDIVKVHPVNYAMEVTVYFLEYERHWTSDIMNILDEFSNDVTSLGTI